MQRGRANIVGCSKLSESYWEDAIADAAFKSNFLGHLRAGLSPSL